MNARKEKLTKLAVAGFSIASVWVQANAMELPDVSSHVKQVTCDSFYDCYWDDISPILKDETAWSDNATPHSGANYLKGADMMLNVGRPGGSTGVYEFPGDQLVLQGDGSLWPRLQIDVANFVCKDLLLFPNSWIQKGANSYPGSIQGQLTAYSTSADDQIFLVLEGGLSLDIAASLHGDGHLVLTGHSGVYSVAGNNSDFKGTWKVCLNADSSDESYRQTLKIASQQSLGGELDVFDWKALQLCNLSKLTALNSLTLDDATRGIAASGDVVIEVLGGQELKMATQLTLGGELRKTGVGTLTLGGAVRYLGANDVPGDVPQPDANVLSVLEGSLKPASTNAFDGMKIVLADGVALSYDLEPADEAVAQYGLLNVRNGTDPLVVQGATIPVRLDGSLPQDNEQVVIALATFAQQELADAFLSKLSFAQTAGYVYQADERVNDDSSVTVRLHVYRNLYELPDVSSHVQQTKCDDFYACYDGDISPILKDETAWSDGATPHPGANYLKGANMMLNIGRPGGATGVYEFPGDQLVLQGDGSLWPRLQIDVANFVCKDLLLFPNSWIQKGVNSYGGQLSGNVTAYSTAANDFIVLRTAHWGQVFDLTADLAGNGHFALIGQRGAAGGYGTCIVTNENPNFHGTWRVAMDETSVYDLETPTEEQHQILQIDSQLALGGPLYVFDWKALYLSQQSELVPLKSFDLDDATRGVAVRGVASINVAEGLELKMATQLTLEGTLRKTGAGLLTLGGTVRYLTEGGALSDVPRTGCNVLAVEEGSLKPASKKACDGLAISLGEGAVLAYDLSSADAGVGDCGLYNVKNTTNPIASQSSTIGVRIDGEPTADRFSVALATFATRELAEAFRGKLAVRKIRGRRHVSEVRANADGTATVLLNFERPGFVLTVR